MTSPLFHIILISFFPILSLFSANLHQAQVTDVIVPILIILPFSLIYLIILKLFTKNIIFSSLAVSTSILFIFLFGDIRKLLRINGLLLSIVIITCLSGVIYWFQKNQSKYTKLTRYFNILSLVLVIMPLLNILFYISGNMTAKNEYNNRFSIPLPQDYQNRQMPDIYYLILDRYAGEKTLKSIYDFDNSEFINTLKTNGFHIVQNSYANYYSSAHSIASSLNMKYLDDEVKVSGVENKDWKFIYSLILNHQAGQIFKRLGYSYFHFGSWWWPTTKNQNADKNINLGLISEFSRVLISNTIFYPWIEEFNVPFIDARFAQWRRINYQFEQLAKIPDLENPTFIFAHLIIPHDPFVFQADGKFLKKEEDKNTDDKIKYVNQLKYLNTKLQKLVSEIIKKEKFSIIIFQADEGPYPDNYEKDKNNFNWNNATKEEIDTKMSIFNAIYFPDGNYMPFSGTSSPVNTLRIVLNQFLGFNLGLLPERYYLGNMKYPYKLVEIKK